MDTIVSHEVNYKAAQSARDVYQLVKIYSNISNGSLALSSSANPSLSFDIPSKPMNMSRSFLNFSMDITAGATQNLAVYTRGVPFLQSVRYTDLGQLTLAEYTNASVFVKAVQPVLTRAADVEEGGYAVVKAGAFLDTDRPLSAFTSLQRAHWSESAAGGGMGNHPSQRGTDDTERLFPATPDDDVTSALGNRIYHSTATETHMRLHFRVPMDSFKHSILAIDKTLMFPKVTNMSFTFNNYHEFIGLADMSGPAVITSVVLNEITMDLAISTDKTVNESLVNKLTKGGMRLDVPYVYSFFNDIGSAESSASIRLNNGQGERVLCIYNVVLPTAAIQQPQSYACNHVNQLVTNYYTTIDGRRIHDSVLRSTHSEDYINMRSILRGSVLQDEKNFKLNRVEIDSFRAGPCVNWGSLDTVQSGYDLTSTDMNYTIHHVVPNVGTLGVNRFLYTFAVLQKSLNISSAGISLF